MHPLHTRELQGVLRSQQGQLDEMREECQALRDCLVATGVLTREALQAQVHRRHFNKVRRMHPLHTDDPTTLASVLAAQELGWSVAGSSDPRSLRALCVVSRSIGVVVASALPALDLRASGNVFVGGGYDGARFL